MKEKDAKPLANRIVLIVLVCFAVLTLLLAGFVLLNSYGAFDREPVVEVRARNGYAETLHVATDWDYKPFSYIENGEYAGLDVEMIAEVANRLEMNLELELLDWNDAQAGLLDGTYDVILNMESNAILRDDRLIGTIPTDEKQYVVYGKTAISHVGELYGTRVAAYNKFDELGMSVITGYSYQEMFEKLLSDELDYIICPIQVGDSFIDKLNARNIIRSSYQVSYMYGCMALKAEDTALCARLNAVIKELQVNGVIERLDEKWVTSRYGTFSFRDVLNRHPALVVLLAVVLQLIIAGVIFIVFSASDSRKRRAYTAELQKNLAIINQQNEELKAAEEKAQAASLAKSKFLFNMSHDIRTPMNAIIGFTNLAERHTGDEAAVRDYLSKISASSDLLLGLINDVLEMARIESGKTVLNPAPENLLTMMDQIEAIVRGQAAEKNQELVFLKEAEHPWVLCDRLKVNQVLMNLISNAVKYTGPGGHIRVSLAETPGKGAGRAGYVIRVKDDGIGMSEEFQQRIFEPFEREQNSTVSKITGTGLGMSIARNLVQLMGGEISLTSAPGKGSEFTVTLELPLAEAPKAPAEAPRGPEAPAEQDVPRRVLVVDDNEINRVIATELLQDMGYETGEAENGEEAVNLIKGAKRGDYDLILMDIQMPVMNGYEAAKAIRGLDSPLASLPIIALTANAFEDDKKNAEKAGMNGHVAKPIDVELLEKTLRKFFPGSASGSPETEAPGAEGPEEE